MVLTSGHCCPRRHLKLNTIPHSLAFANDHGDLLVGIERHLYRIQHSKYLPRSYLLKVPETDSPRGRRGGRALGWVSPTAVSRGVGRC